MKLSKIPTASDRCRKKLRPAFWIGESESEIIFRMHWGREQQLAEEFRSIYIRSIRDVSAKSKYFSMIIDKLKGLEPVRYRKRPKSESPPVGEKYRWCFDYQKMLRVAEEISASLSLQGVRAFYGVGGCKGEAAITVVFSKKTS